ncbi:bifunctional methylenetetrahydrofolate dehydrogenase/methenyltetrahydrofolate cyclohydrolase FolD [Sedimentisphaera salicampi]|uniref:Bifunctional protein FolD n=1 Tax=Sedimentisphaera salicampi TaxID=1941349 RepID=A0A1W6LJ32_9BACT|nr:bifunctional methylenetetrahydrofolate dehydrogenase/methenyltetrahydrofolate cyclohydrolase FolD [Sedimentisphaera salicampi]ARN55798.1 Bifunctional protein FolD protein [Sedimentisphaera salicampi]OXU15991.1 Bifunctional protein FolD protein [Sedimentisphaera salicampi]
MTAEIISGKQLASDIRGELKQEVESLKEKGITPGLAVILVGEDPASQSYVRAKEKACAEIGIYSDDNKLPSDISEEKLLSLIEEKNNDPSIHGILVQLPLPKHIDEAKVLLAVNPDKDVDGFHPVNVGKLVVGQKAFLPCTPHGIVQMIKRAGVQLEGANVVIVGRSNIVGKPLANILMQKSELGNATVTVCHTRTKDISKHTIEADIVVAATGFPNSVTADMVKEGAVVIDVGVNRVPDDTKKKGYRLIGDVDFDAVSQKASFITPVPGGVGPMTITMLLYNTVDSSKTANNIK